MAYAPDSTQPGFLGPTTETLSGLAWEDFLQALVAGITGLDPTLVRPRFQPKPPTTPDVTVDWCAVGLMNVAGDWSPPIIHVPDGQGHDLVSQQERVTLLCSFYGPNAGPNAGILRDGIWLDQNRAVLRANAVGLVEVGEFTRVAELFRQQFRDRVDTNVILNRQVRRTYQVLNLVSAQGTIIANDPGGRIVEDDFDTINVGS